MHFSNILPMESSSTNSARGIVFVKRSLSCVSVLVSVRSYWMAFVRRFSGTLLTRVDEIGLKRVIILALSDAAESVGSNRCRVWSTGLELGPDMGKSSKCEMSERRARKVWTVFFCDLKTFSNQIFFLWYLSENTSISCFDNSIYLNISDGY